MQTFISHVNQDSKLAGILASQLAQSGFNVWNPEDAIEPGDNWATKLGQALDESDVMVVLYTRQREIPTPFGATLNTLSRREIIAIG